MFLHELVQHHVVRHSARARALIRLRWAGRKDHKMPMFRDAPKAVGVQVKKAKRTAILLGAHRCTQACKILQDVASYVNTNIEIVGDVNNPPAGIFHWSFKIILQTTPIPIGFPCIPI